MSDPLPSKPTLYVLQSLKDHRTYVGSTNNFEKRLLLHNSGRVKSTKHRIPFKLLFTEEFPTSKEAKKREHYYKSGAGRRKLKEFFKSRTYSKYWQWNCNFKISPTKLLLGIIK